MRSKGTGFKLRPATNMAIKMNQHVAENNYTSALSSTLPRIATSGAARFESSDLATELTSPSPQKSGNRSALSKPMMTMNYNSAVRSSMPVSGRQISGLGDSQS